MTHTKNYVAIDLGAESGRAILGSFDGERLVLKDIHRFANTPVRVNDQTGKSHLHWDILRLWSEIKTGLVKAVQESGQNISGLGIDTWGVDFGLLDANGELLANPHHYRDNRTDGMMDEVFKSVPRAEVFQHTGIQFIQLNSLYQIFALAKAQSVALKNAQTFLMIPDLLNFWLTGKAVCEFSDATTTQFYNPILRDWDRGLLERLGIPTHIFPTVVPPGTNLGPLLAGVAEEIGLEQPGSLSVIAPACHDTGSAVAAIPAVNPGFAWISSGTWSIVGVEWPEAVISAKSLAYNFTNEGGVNHTYRFSRNVMGMWLVQECRREWARHGEELSYAELTRLASEAEPAQALIDPDDGEFFKPGDMTVRIVDYCQRTGQPALQSKAAFMRCILESLALKYRWVVERLEEMVEQKLTPVHIVGGGTQNALLNQLTADILQRPVITGPIEATALGNLLMQLLALGDIKTLEEGRRLVKTSFPPVEYQPGSPAGWDEKYARFLKLLG